MFAFRVNPKIQDRSRYLVSTGYALDQTQKTGIEDGFDTWYHTKLNIVRVEYVLLSLS
jgi:hypothetical protein